MTAPQLDKRTIGDIEAAAEALAALPDYTPDWTGVGEGDDPGWQLVGLFARMMELLIERVNRVPEKNFLEFLDMVGVEPSPGNAASVPVTFLLSNKAPEGGEVPAGTQLATTQTETADAQVFETRSAFFATPARLLAGVNLIPDSESYSLLKVPDLPPDAAALEPDPAITPVLGAIAATDVDHVLYLAEPSLFARAASSEVTVIFAVTDDRKDIFREGALEWRIYSAAEKGWAKIEKPPIYDLSVPNRAHVTFADFKDAAPVEIDGVEAVWLAGHLISAADDSLALPTVTDVRGTYFTPGDTVTAPTIETAFGNALPLDFSKPAYPFGQRPKYGDAFYIGSDDAFAPEVESVTLHFTLRPYTDADLAAKFLGIRSPTDLSQRTIRTEIAWQYLAEDGNWRDLEIYEYEIVASLNGSPPPAVNIARNGAPDGALHSDSPGEISITLTVPNDAARGEVAQIESYWMRAIIRSEDPYGRDGFLETVSPTEFNYVGPTFIPPVIESARMTYSYPTDPSSVATPMEHIRYRNNFGPIESFATPGPSGSGFQPFVRLSESDMTAAFGSDPAIYLGFDRPFGAAFISLFIHLEEVFDAELPQLEAGDPQLVWEYLADGMIWKPLDVTDGTANLTTSGTVSFLGPLDSIGADLFPQLAVAPAPAASPVWYRARLNEGRYDHPPRLGMVLLNTVMADNRATTSELVAGSGSGMPNQRLTLTRTPVLDTEIWVREAEIPSADAALPPESIDIREPAIEGGERQIWIRWTRRPNFLSSGPDSRHYTLEATGGTLAFGDGLNGFIPPIAKDNIVARNLLVGGGEDANRLALPLAVKQLKTSLPFVDKVFNVQGATGGSDPWDQQQTLELGPQLIKNKDRAVTTEDFEWLVRANFSQVARVRCLATRSPASDGGLAFTPGAVTLIIVPKGSERTPQPPKGLLKQIADDLRARSFGGIFAEIHTLAPEYLPVRVAATLSPLRPEESSQLARRATQALEAFLHPLTGGEDGAGWGFGRSVYLSEIFAVLQAVEGVDHVVDASLIDAAPSAASLPIGEHALVASGSHEIGVV